MQHYVWTVIWLAEDARAGTAGRGGTAETMICFWGAVRLLPPAFWNCSRNPCIITLGVILKLGEIMHMSWVLCLWFIISCGSWWVGSTWTDTGDGVPFPASLTVLPPLLSGGINKQWKFAFEFERMKIPYHSSTLGCFLTLPLDEQTHFPCHSQDACPCFISCNKVLTVILFSWRQFWQQSWCESRAHEDGDFMKPKFHIASQIPCTLQCFPLLPKARLDLFSLQVLFLCLPQ